MQLKIKLVLITIAIVGIILGISYVVMSGTVNPMMNNKKYPVFNYDYHGDGQQYLMRKQSGIFEATVFYDDITVWTDDEFKAKRMSFGLKPENNELYKKIHAGNDNVVVVIPVFTEIAYENEGFYSYYQKLCDERCLTAYFNKNYTLSYNSSDNGFKILSILGYHTVSDIDIDENPGILKKYDKVILLHNEYVSQNEFDAITNHKNVVYLYPNALHAKIEADYVNGNIRLIRGHGYPESSIENGFDWPYDNTHPDEFDTSCDDWKFRDVPNGHMLNCYPETKLYLDINLLQAIKDI